MGKLIIKSLSDKNVQKWILIRWGCWFILSLSFGPTVGALMIIPVKALVTFHTVKAWKKEKKK
jgi:hypothetical protein